MSIFGRQVESSSGFLASIWKEYGKADTRWLYADPTVVSIEIITVVGAGLLSFAVLYALVNDLPSRHFLQVLLCTAELYGDWMTFAPEWLTGSPSLVTENPMYLWVYLTLFNGLWVVVPLLLLAHSYQYLQGAVSQYQHRKLE
ncbi:Emopamil-binding protein [Basidiobolus meristosporus CBS 931.73]|uniref:Emopamil-binding protein n=1 Tax=Basidiobolus meristosporus CBS 931.73 TaxID=1314790 RepID=A0A1Y1YCV5_9FUNG|nr:Emopamil-binding protein [Basidiobolus meristosporus CBS 931.73]|eukprot:ORX95763.1 Emopamil-binding protein [Basidiobolus meristosporus CBS 931.73]